MQIIWYGQSFFGIGVKGNGGGGEIKIVIDPYGDELGLKMPKVEAQILLITHDHLDHANRKLVAGNPFIIEGPGEYELKGVFIKGVPAFHDDQKGSQRGVVTIYKIEAEDIRICHLADLGQKELLPEQIEELGEVDVLMVPVGGKFTIDGKEASEIISQIEPKIVIPMHYQISGLKADIEGVEKFLKVMGVEGLERQKKLKISRKELPQEETQIFLLEP